MKVLRLLLSLAVLVMLPVLSFASPMTEYHGGLFDDGFYDDDWYVDYYDSMTGDERARTGSSDGDDEYDASQFYDDAGESGLFDV